MLQSSKETFEVAGLAPLQKQNVTENLLWGLVDSAALSLKWDSRRTLSFFSNVLALRCATFFFFCCFQVEEEERLFRRRAGTGSACLQAGPPRPRR